MHSDFHYFATYSMARAAGLDKDTCQTIATAAQFVDDNKEGEKNIRFEDGGRLHLIPTSHPLKELINTSFLENLNLIDNDQRTVWLPFHFLPGNDGEEMSERMVCRKDSEISKKMMKHCLSMENKPFGLYLIGIATHVYADTFSHYGFSGVSSRWNKVDGSSIKLENEESNDSRHLFSTIYELTKGNLPNWKGLLSKEFKSEGAELYSGALGHGGVLKYPDYPYLKWNFTYEHSGWKEKKLSQRNNVEDYLEACQKLHEIFCMIRLESSGSRIDEGRKFEDIKEKVIEILKYENPDPVERSKKWQNAASKGELFSGEEEILHYLGDSWQHDIEKLKDESDSTDSQSVRDKPVFKFYQAAATYRTYVLRDLLPRYGLVMD